RDRIALQIDRLLRPVQPIEIPEPPPRRPLRQSRPPGRGPCPCRGSLRCVRARASPAPSCPRGRQGGARRQASDDRRRGGGAPLRDHLPAHLGLRFSRNALAPSRRSSVVRSSVERSPSRRRPLARGSSRPLTTDSLA